MKFICRCINYHGTEVSLSRNTSYILCIKYMRKCINHYRIDVMILDITFINTYIYIYIYIYIYKQPTHWKDEMYKTSHTCFIILHTFSLSNIYANVSTIIRLMRLCAINLCNFLYMKDIWKLNYFGTKVLLSHNCILSGWNIAANASTVVGYRCLYLLIHLTFTMRNVFVNVTTIMGQRYFCPIILYIFSIWNVPANVSTIMGQRYFCPVILYTFHHHHHHVMPPAWISLTLSRHFSRSFLASGWSSGLHLVSSQSCCMYIRAGHPALLGHMWGSIGVHHLWAHPCFSSSVLHVWFIYIG